MRVASGLVAAGAAILLRATAEMPPPAVDVLVVGGTAKGVSAAVAARQAGAKTFLVTSQPYLGEDLAGTLELDAPPETPLEKRLWANATGHAAYDYWPARPSDGIRWIYKNDWWERISEPGIPPSPSDAVWYNDDISYRCVLRKPAKIARVEVVALAKGTEADSASAALVVKAGPRKGETIELTRRPAAFKIMGDYYRGNAEAISFSADVGAELSEVEVVVRKTPGADHQLVSRIWFHLADASIFDAPPSPLKVKRTFDRVLLDADVGFLTCSPVRRVLRGADGRLAGVEIVNRSGRRVIRAKRVVDATRLGVLDSFEKGAVPVGAKATFSRRVITAGVKPSAPGLAVEELPGVYPITHTQSSATGRLYRCTFEWPMKDGAFPSFAAAEWAARELTFTRRLMDDADLLVWRRERGAPAVASDRIREGERLGREAAAAARTATLPDKVFTQGEIPLWGTYDVVVVGGGTSGTPAALAAARAGAKVLLVEYLNVLGGVGTDGMILGYYDGNPCGFTEEFKQENRRFRDSFGLNVRASTWRKLCRDAGVEVWLGAMGSGATVENGKVTEVEVATEMGCGRVRATCFIDATGNADVAAAAGARTEFLSAREFALQSAGQAPHRLGRGGINSDFGFVNDSDAADVWLFGVRARAGAPDAWDIAKLPDSRERRRIVPDYAVNAQDVTSRRPFPDVVVQAQSRQDSHGYLTDEFRFLSEPSAVVVPGKGELRYQFIVNVPLRSLLPQGLSGLAVIGLGAGYARDVLPIVRMQADFMNMGYAVGTAAAMVARKGGEFRAVDRQALRQALVEKGILRAEALDWNEEADVSSDALLAASVASMAHGFKGSHVVCRPENRARALPLLRAAYAKAQTPAARQIYALTLGLFGDPTGVETLLQVVKGTDPVCKVRTKGSFGGGSNSKTGFMIALGRTKDPRACDVLLPSLKPIRPGVSLNAVRDATLALEALGDPRAAPALAKCLRQKGLQGYAVSDPRVLPPQGGYGLGPEMDNCLRELALARALIACGDNEGLARRTFEAYARDPRGVLSAHAKAVLQAYSKK